MNQTQLERIEADVVLVAINNNVGTVHVQPLWGCTIEPKDLFREAALFGLWATEQDGRGWARVEIHDFRTKV